MTERARWIGLIVFLVVCLGAGNITAWANDLPAALTAAWAGNPASNAEDV